MKTISREQAIADGKLRFFTGIACRRGHVSERYTKGGMCIECCSQGNKKYLKERMTSDPVFSESRKAQTVAWRRANPEKNRESEIRYRAKNPNRAKRNSENAVAWKKAHPEKVKESQKRWRCKNQQKAAASHKKWRQDNRERMRAYQKEYREKHPQKARDAVKRWENKDPKRSQMVKRASRTNRRVRIIINGGRCTAADIAALFEKQNGRCAACPCETGLQVDHVLPVALGGSSDPSNLQLLCFPCNRSKGKKHPDVWREEIRLRATQN